MNRRSFIGAVTTVVIAAPLAANVQTATKIRRIGVLDTGVRPTPAELQEEYAPLRARLGGGPESAH